MQYMRYIKKISEAIEKRANYHLLQHDLTLAQMHILLLLSRCEDYSRSLKELEQLCHTAQSTVAGTVKRLEAKGMIESLTCPEDKRIKRVRLTGEGLEACAKTRRDIAETEAWIVHQLEEEEKEELERLLKKVFDSIHECSESAGTNQC